MKYFTTYRNGIILIKIKFSSKTNETMQKYKSVGKNYSLI